MRPAALIPALVILGIIALASCQSCSWEIAQQNRRYSFDIAASLKTSPHGVRSEDGFYKVSQLDASNDSTTTYWFQLCEFMKFNHDPPKCFKCETCGGPEHCGETCSALMATSFPGFSVCTTLGFASNTIFSLIDVQDPEKGLAVNMSANSQQGHCSFTVYIFCNTKTEELSSVVDKQSFGKCDYTVTLKHPAGCPVVAHIKGKGLGWFSILVIIIVCGFAVYMIGGIIYRRRVLGVSGLEAIPNLEFWRSVPSSIRLGFQRCIGYITGCYRRFTEPSYMRVG